uniref:Uncharacterized protein n=1 Tax=Vitis vinifera TaxID=29760 RepID=F6I578_VITVI
MSPQSIFSLSLSLFALCLGSKQTEEQSQELRLGSSGRGLGRFM